MKLSGNPNVVELPPLERWTKTGGKVLVRRWTGPSALIGPDTIGGTKAAQLRAAGLDYEIEKSDGRLPIISASYSDRDTQPPDVPLSDTWTMDVNDAEKDIWELPLIVKEIEKTFATQAKAYAGAQAIKDIKAMLRGEVVEQDGRVITLEEAIGVCGIAGMNVAILWDFIQDLLRGVAVFPVDQYVIRRERVVTDNTAIKASTATDNTGRMFSTVSMKAIEKAPATFPVVGDMPAGYWLKKKPKAAPAAPGKWRIVQEYLHATSFSKNIYGAAL